MEEERDEVLTACRDAPGSLNVSWTSGQRGKGREVDEWNEWKTNDVSLSYRRSTRLFDRDRCVDEAALTMYVRGSGGRQGEVR
ncbi:hypothetical protein E2C01_056419 [Portunus trituberculatus]|uniref:Uncharacterized protein n=1 Tax=Portunus trituberculatus TaxID=210409 RepID=A0A5B7GY48_PORTR|nr:hypothetical protein [Portunus trituberculatus]